MHKPALKNYYRTALTALLQRGWSTSPDFTLAEQALELHLTRPEYGIQLAKSLAVTGKENAAAEILRNVNEKDVLYAVKVLVDPDLISKKPIQSMLDFVSKSLIEMVEKEMEVLST